MNRELLIQKLYALDSYEACKALAEEILTHFTPRREGREAGGKVADDLTMEEINKAFGNANFGVTTPVQVVSQGLLKCASGWYQGHTSNGILQDLGLITEKYRLTERGRKNLWGFFKDTAVNL